MSKHKKITPEYVKEIRLERMIKPVEEKFEEIDREVANIKNNSLKDQEIALRASVQEANKRIIELIYAVKHLICTAAVDILSSNIKTDEVIKESHEILQEVQNIVKKADSVAKWGFRASIASLLVSSVTILYTGLTQIIP